MAVTVPRNPGRPRTGDSKIRTRRLRRLAVALWLAWAVVAWNVVFDHTMEVAGREYLHAAAVAAHDGGRYERIDAWMQPAVSRGLWKASATALAILAIGFAGLRLASGA